MVKTILAVCFLILLSAALFIFNDRQGYIDFESYGAVKEKVYVAVEGDGKVAVVVPYG